MFFCRFVPFAAIVHALYVLLRFTASDYPFGIFKLFFCPSNCWRQSIFGRRSSSRK